MIYFHVHIYCPYKERLQKKNFCRSIAYPYNWKAWSECILKVKITGEFPVLTLAKFYCQIVKAILYRIYTARYFWSITVWSYKRPTWSIRRRRIQIYNWMAAGRTPGNDWKFLQIYFRPAPSWKNIISVQRRGRNIAKIGNSYNFSFGQILNLLILIFFQHCPLLSEGK